MFKKRLLRVYGIICSIILWTMGLYTIGSSAAESESMQSDRLAEVKASWQAARQEIEAALADQGRTVLDLESPKWFEVPYNAIGRLPLIDTCLREPLSQPEIAIWADEQARQVATSFMGQLTLAYRLSEQTSSDFPYAPSIQNLPLDELPFAEQLQKVPLPTQINQVLSIAYNALKTASELREHAFSSLTPEEKNRISVLLPGFFVRQTPTGEMIRGYTTNVEECVELFELLTKVDFRDVFEAAAILAQAGDRVGTLLDGLTSLDDPALCTPVLFETSTDLGKIVIGGTAQTTYTDEYALLIDLGGDDLYCNHPAATSLSGYGAALCIDLAGNDTYRSDGPAQGSAQAGVTLFWDRAGHDLYVSTHYSQGAALAGFSFFRDDQGDDTYMADLGAQCFALFGYSLFTERGGRDTYRCAANGQGAASMLGVALLTECDGDDSYRAGGKYGFYYTWDSSTAQGAASGMRQYPPRNTFTIYGGIGFLSEWAGHDVYHAYNIGQGGSYIFALGMLVDSEGNDTYTSKNYCRGVGVHLSAAVALDLAGDDLHNGLYGNNGYSLDRSSGVFVDFGGNDTYRTSGGIGFGHKPKGTGIFIDVTGDDTYAGWENNYGKADYPFGDEAYSTGFFLDYGGHDHYRGDLYRDDTSWAEGSYGYGHDRELDISGPVTSWWSPDQPAGPESNTARTDTFSGPDRLGAPVALVRISALAGPIDALIESLLEVSHSPERAKRRQIIDTIQYLLTRKVITDQQAPTLAPLLTAEDYDVRLAGLELMSKTKTRDATVIAMMDTLARHDPSDEVRGMACLALAEAGLPESVSTLIAALDDEQWRVRRRAALALSKLNNQSARERLVLALQSDQAFQVRAYAAEALGQMGLPENKTCLEAALSDSSEFVRCQAARALLLHFDYPQAFTTLFELLNWKNQPLRSNWVDSFLSMYTGMSLPAQPEKWREWWATRQDTFDWDLHRRLFALIKEADEQKMSSETEQAIGTYRQVLDLAPEHNAARKELADLLHTSAWDKVVSGQDLEKGLVLAREAIDLTTNPDTLDTLAVLYYLLGQTEQAILTIKQAIADAPDDQKHQFRDRLEQIETNTVLVR
ncbi:HEAT repeat domain-containing protein [bacterium]|nr:HEAT repeat domain-containing protein [bacterium]